VRFPVLAMDGTAIFHPAMRAVNIDYIDSERPEGRSWRSFEGGALESTTP
jgi:hypothetical protein